MLKIVIDTGCDLNTFIKNSKYTFEQVPLILNIDGVNFEDDRNLDIESYLQAMEQSKNPVKSAAPSPEAFLKAFNGADEVYCLTISSLMSASYSSANVAKELYLEQNPNAKVHIIDTKLATSGETAVVCKLIERLDQGYRNEELLEVFKEDLDLTICYFVLESFQNLTKNGRLNPMISKIANVMNIKPICKGFNHDMTLEFKPRGSKKAYQKLIDIVCLDSRITEKSTLYITHIQALDTANNIKKMINEKIKVKDIIINECTGLCASYAERFGIVVAY